MRIQARRMLGLAGLGALVLASSPAHAQAEAHFDIPAQTLADSLRAVGSETDTNILFDPKLVAGRRVAALKATLTAAEAISRLLAGTGIRYRFINATTIVLEAENIALPRGSGRSPAQLRRGDHPAGKVPKLTAPRETRAETLPGEADGTHASQRAHDRLAEVVVTSLYKRDADASMKMGIPVRDTPLSIESYSHSFLNSIETQQVADLYRYMTGLQKAGLTGYDLTIRGFSTSDPDRNTVLTDGLPGLSVRFGSPPTIGISHVELVKGATSLLYGQATPGGFVNIITKKPEAVGRTELETRGTLNASAYPRERGGDVSFDSTGPLGTDRILYRLIGQISDDRYFRSSSYQRGKYLEPMLTVRLGEATTATLQFEYRSVSADYENVGLLAPVSAVAATVTQLAPIQTTYTAPGTSRNERGTTTSLFIRHAIARGGSLNLSVRSVDHHDYANAFDITGFDKSDSTQHTLDLRARAQWNQRTYNFADANAVLTAHTGDIRHRVLVGIDAGKEIDDFHRIRFCALNSPGQPQADPTCNIGTSQFSVSILDPSFGSVPPPSAFGAGKPADNWNLSQTAAAYLLDLVTLSSRWKALAGVRYSRDRLEVFINRLDPAQPPFEQTTSTTLPQIGVIFQPDPLWSFYASYSTSYTPVDPSTPALVGSPLFKPVQGKGAEVGVKAELLEHRLDLTGAAFLINETNVLDPYSDTSAQQCPTGSCDVQVGAARSKGMELELDAKPSDAWTLIAGYAYTDARVTASSAAGPIVGQELPDSPRNAFHAWTRYDVLDGTLRGFGVGVGYSYVGTRVANTGTLLIPGQFILPGYQVVDLALYKRFGTGLAMTLKIDNLFDATYYQDGTITSGMVSVDAGAPRAAELYLTYVF
jgi:iron complex outermembrane recepter protein